MCAEWFRDGGWKPVDREQSFSCRSNSGVGRCIIEEYLEVSVDDSQEHPYMRAPKDGEGVNFKNTFVGTAPGTWQRWDSSFDSMTGRDAPYVLC